MNKILKIILIVGFALTLLGSCIFFAGMMLSDWDFSALSDTVIEEKTYVEPADSPVTRLSLSFENADITVRFDEQADTLTVVYPQEYDRKGEEKTEITLEETDGGISITEHSILCKNLISFWDFASRKVTVTLPVKRTYDLQIESHNGAIFTETVVQKNEDGTLVRDETLCRVSALTLRSNNGQIHFGDTDYLYCEGGITCETDNGKITLGQFETKSLFVRTNNGDVAVERGSVAEAAILSTDNGDVRINQGLEAGRIELESDNGKLISTGELIANEVKATTNNGDIALRRAIRAQEIHLETDNGDVNATLGGAHNDYNMTVEHDLGDSNVANRTGGAKNLFVKTDTGDIEVIFVGEESSAIDQYP